MQELRKLFFKAFVALRKESVDRNGMEINGVSYDVWSLSARRAWIEMMLSARLLMCFWLSLSARRAWIEIGAGLTGQ